MATKKMDKNIFEQLNKLNVNEFTKKKGNFTYLSWAWAVRELLQIAPDATWVIHEFESWNAHGSVTQPYMNTGTGYFVKVTVTVNGVDRTQVHPVLDNRNKTIDDPNAFQVNTSIQRCLAKAIALHGLGLYIFAGEDLPVDEPITKAEMRTILALAEATGDESKFRGIGDMLDNGSINRSNYSASKAKLERLVKENKKDETIATTK